MRTILSIDDDVAIGNLEQGKTEDADEKPEDGILL